MSKAARLTNPYLARFSKLSCVRGFYKHFQPGIAIMKAPNRRVLLHFHEQARPIRDRMVRMYAYAIPTAAAIKLIAKYSPYGVLEVGAGLGYWAWMLRQHGTDVLAFDQEPDVKKNGYFSPCPEAKPWTEVSKGDAAVVTEHPHRTLLLCWPEVSVAHECLNSYSGDCIIFVGDLKSRLSCGSYSLFSAALDSDWMLTDRLEIPTWPGAADRLYVYRRLCSAPSPR